MTRAHVRLLGPCFKTGQVDTDLLAIDCHIPPDTAASISGLQESRFQHKLKSNPSSSTHYGHNTDGMLYWQTPHKREVFLVGTLEADAENDRYNTGQNTSILPGTFNQPSHTVAPAIQLVMASQGN